MNTLMWFVALGIFFMTIISGAIPFLRQLRKPCDYDFPVGEALANGVFLGAGLIHMLPDSVESFSSLGIKFPWPFVICGAVFLLFLLSEHVGYFINDGKKNQSYFIAVSSTLMLSVHSFFTGAAIGLTDSTSLLMVLFVAVLAHKWAASFSLSLYINKTALSFKNRAALFLVFSLMVPLGIVFGGFIHQYCQNNQLIQPIFSAVAAGTFVYLGTLHGFKKMLTQKECCNLYQYGNVLFGFSLMSVVAAWV